MNELERIESQRKEWKKYEGKDKVQVIGQMLVDLKYKPIFKEDGTRVFVDVCPRIMIKGVY